MTAKNDITGDEIKTKAGNEAYSDGWDRIFTKRPTKEQEAALDELVRVTEELGLYDQIPLDKDCEKILNDNLWELYSR